VKIQYIKKLNIPDTSGVYFFKKDNSVLYIGKATSLKDRVKSYFSNDLLETRSPIIAEMVLIANKLEFQKTHSVLEALILEANLIKKYQPRYNIKEKDDKSFNFVIITDEDFPRVLLVRGREIEKGLPYKTKVQFGPFTDGTSLRLAMKIIRKIFPFRDKCIPLSGRPCFNRQLGLCPGVCDGAINKKDYSKIIAKIKIFLSGKTDILEKSLKREMKVLSKKQEFEKAGEIKRQIFALEHIQDISLVKNDESIITKSFRIEAYDVAHISGTNIVGAMAVFQNGEMDKREYRKFKIRNSSNDDLKSLEEILERRFKHTEWQMPNIVVVDGGQNQINITKKVLHKNGFNFEVVSVLKSDNHKPKAIIGNEHIIKKYKKEILLANSEAHRFAIKYHRNLRDNIDY